MDFFIGIPGCIYRRGGSKVYGSGKFVAQEEYRIDSPQGHLRKTGNEVLSVKNLTVGMMKIPRQGEPDELGNFFCRDSGG
jgi:hypothetical protein